MGKASRWFRGLLGLKKQQPSHNSASSPAKHKRRWSFVKSHTQQNGYNNHVEDASADNPNNHAIAVAAATAAVAEAAVAAAHAAAAVVRLTSSSGRCGGGGSIATTARREWAAVKIQAAFRGCLARKALRALKGLVKLQAMVRGHIERKRTAEWVKRMQSLLASKARVRAQILHTSNSTSKSSSCHLHGPATPDKFESPIRSKSMKHEQSPILKRNGSKSCVHANISQEKCRNKSESQTDEHSWNQQERSSIRTCSTNDEKSEVDSGRPQQVTTSKRRNLFPSDPHCSKNWTATKDSTPPLHSGQSLSCEIQYHTTKGVAAAVEESPFCTAENSPQFLSATSSKDNGSKRSPFTPNRSGGSSSRSYLYSENYCPSYMAYTESSKAKVRSLSAPKQRPHQYERSTSSSNRYSLNNGFGEPNKLGAQRGTAWQSSFTSKAYPGSGRLDKLGMPVGYRY